MQNRKKLRLANSVINLTGKDFSMYDDVTGDICSFPTCDFEVPERPTTFMRGHQVFYYVVREEIAKMLIDSGRPVYDIAVLQGIDTGRDGAEIATLYWAENPEFKVRISRNKTFL